MGLVTSSSMEQSGLSKPEKVDLLEPAPANWICHGVQAIQGLVVGLGYSKAMAGKTGWRLDYDLSQSWKVGRPTKSPLITASMGCGFGKACMITWPDDSTNSWDCRFRHCCSWTIHEWGLDQRELGLLKTQKLGSMEKAALSLSEDPESTQLASTPVKRKTEDQGGPSFTMIIPPHIARHET